MNINNNDDAEKITLKHVLNTQPFRWKKHVTRVDYLIKIAR